MLIYAACDTRYLSLYGAAFVTSAKAHGHDVEIFCDGKSAGARVDKMRYCTERFRMLPDLLRKHGAALMLDVDSIIRRPVVIEPEFDLGIFLRPAMPDKNLKTLCTAFYCTDRAMDFAELMAAKCVDYASLPWCGEQGLLWETWEALGDKYHAKKLDQSFVDWKQETKAPIYTGKGPVKFDRGYVNETRKWVERAECH